ncbi:MAG: hypothetical protein ACLFR1_02460 [Spirochaetia bacterium]
MTFSEIITELNCTAYHTREECDECQIHHVVTSDLMSEVLVVDEEDLILVTSLTTDQAVRTADIVGAYGILLANDKAPQENMKKLAKESDLTLLSTPLSTFSACVELGKLLGK